MHHRHAGLHRQRRHGQMRQRAATDGAVGELVRLPLDGGKQALDAIGRHVRREGQHARLRGEDRDRRNVLPRLVRHLGKQQMVDHQRPDDAHPQRVSIRRRLGHRRRAGIAAGARPVLDDERLGEPLLQALGHDPRQAVRRRAGDERHDDGDLPGRPLLRLQGAPAARKGNNACHKLFDHAFPLVRFLLIWRVVCFWPGKDCRATSCSLAQYPRRIADPMARHANAASACSPTAAGLDRNRRGLIAFSKTKPERSLGRCSQLRSEALGVRP